MHAPYALSVSSDQSIELITLISASCRSPRKTIIHVINISFSFRHPSMQMQASHRTRKRKIVDWKVAALRQLHVLIRTSWHNIRQASETARDDRDILARVRQCVLVRTVPGSCGTVSSVSRALGPICLTY